MKKIKAKAKVAAKKAVKKVVKAKEKVTKTEKVAKTVAQPKVKAAASTKNTSKITAVAPKAAMVVKAAASKTDKKAAAVMATSKPAAVKANMQAAGQARVIEPLSWDAIKPKLNTNPAPKLTKRDNKDDSIDVKSYSIRARYTVGDRVMHDEFGKGLVRDVIGDFKIRVAFRDCEKVLVHGISN